ncbi:MAG: hypothetical protein LBD78_05430 [Spirochaetaceae bacterium]|nr:hypothetical protein [Spirochaetaceae bacterium]
MVSHVSPISVFSLRKKMIPLFITVFLFTLTALLPGCKHEPDEKGSLAGVWKNVYHDPTGEYPDYVTEITITGNTVVYQGSYEAEIVNTPNFEAPYGVLIIKFTKYATNYDGNPVTTHANVGKYGALYWKDLTVSLVYLADAYTGYTHRMFTNLQAAQMAFTDEKVGDYVDWSITSPYNK